jgi:hypothetical protein
MEHKHIRLHASVSQRCFLLGQKISNVMAREEVSLVRMGQPARFQGSVLPERAV